MTSQRLQATGNKLATFQDPRKGAGGRRPKALKSGHRALQGEGHCRSEALSAWWVLSCRSFKPFPSKLVYSRFPPGSGVLRPDPVFLQWRCFLAFSTCQTGRHRRCPKRAPRGLQEVIQRAQKEPPDHQISPVILVLRTQQKHKTKQRSKPALTIDLVQSIGPKQAPRVPKDSHQVANYHR